MLISLLFLLYFVCKRCFLYVLNYYYLYYINLLNLIIMTKDEDFNRKELNRVYPSYDPKYDTRLKGKQDKPEEKKEESPKEKS